MQGIVAGACTSLNIVQLFAAILIARLHIFLIYYSVKNKGIWRCIYVAFSSFMSNDGKKSELIIIINNNKYVLFPLFDFVQYKSENNFNTSFNLGYVRRLNINIFTNVREKEFPEHSCADAMAFGLPYNNYNMNMNINVNPQNKPHQTMR